MITIFRRFRRLNIALLAAGAVAACSQMPSSQQAVQSSNPSVTYNYRTDQELLRANQNATTYCGQYQTTPRTAGLTNRSSPFLLDNLPGDAFALGRATGRTRSA
jgi:hypothetical protein